VAQYKTIELLRKYCLNDREVSVEVLSDPAENFHSKFHTVNYEDPNVNLAIFPPLSPILRTILRDTALRSPSRAYQILGAVQRRAAVLHHPRQPRRPDRQRRAAGRVTPLRARHPLGTPPPLPRRTPARF